MENNSTNNNQTCCNSREINERNVQDHAYNNDSRFNSNEFYERYRSYMPQSERYGENDGCYQSENYRNSCRERDSENNCRSNSYRSGGNCGSCGSYDSCGNSCGSCGENSARSSSFGGDIWIWLIIFFIIFSSGCNRNDCD